MAKNQVRQVSNDLTNCYLRFNVDIMMLYISAMDYGRKIKFSSLCSSAIYKQNVLILLRLSDSVQCRRRYYFRAWVLY